MKCLGSFAAVAAGVITLALVLSTATGCQKTPPPAPTPTPDSLRTGTVIGKGTTFLYAASGEGVAVVILCDRGIGGGLGQDRDSGGLRGHLYVAPDGSRLEVVCRTVDGKAGAVTIDGSTYDLSQGAVFLVRTRGERRVTQLRRDTSAWRPDDPRGFLTSAEGDPEIGAFVTSAAKATTP
jgi:hypothetical protein